MVMTETRGRYSTDKDMPLNVFDRRERRYALPLNGTPEEAVKAALKSWRNPERFNLASRHEGAYGRVLPLSTTFALDVNDQADKLPEPTRTILNLYFRVERPTLPRDHPEQECGNTCQAHYGNPQIARALGNISPQSVAQFKQHGVHGLAFFFWPAYYRRMRRRKMTI